MTVKEECPKEESLQILDFQRLVSLMEGNMMVDVTVKSKNDRLPKPPCLEMLLQSSLLRFKELIKVKKGLTTSCLFFENARNLGRSTLNGEKKAMALGA